MDWSSIGRTLASSGLTVLGTALGGPAGGIIGRLVGEALGVSDPADPAAVKSAIDADPAGAAAKLRDLEAARRHELEVMDLRAQMQSIREVHKTARVEVASKDGFVRRMRALGLLFIYLMVGAQVGTVLYLAVTNPAALSHIAEAFQALMIPQSIVCALVGIYIPLRTREKLADAGYAPTGGLLGAFLAGRKKEAKDD